MHIENKISRKIIIQENGWIFFACRQWCKIVFIFSGMSDRPRPRPFFGNFVTATKLLPPVGTGHLLVYYKFSIINNYPTTKPQ